MRFQLLFIACFAVSTAHAQLPLIQERGVVFTPRMTQLDATIPVWQTDWGSYQKYVLNTRMLELRIKVVGNVRPDFGILWYFFARDTSDQNRIFTFGFGKSVASLGPGGEVVVRMASPMFGGTAEKYIGSPQTESGPRPDGWGVALVQEGRVVAVSTSRTDFIPRTKAEAASTLKELAAAREKENTPKKKKN